MWPWWIRGINATKLHFVIPIKSVRPAVRSIFLHPLKFPVHWLHSANFPPSSLIFLTFNLASQIQRFQHIHLHLSPVPVLFLSPCLPLEFDRCVGPWADLRIWRNGAVGAPFHGGAGAGRLDQETVGLALQRRVLVRSKRGDGARRELTFHLPGSRSGLRSMWTPTRPRPSIQPRVRGPWVESRGPRHQLLHFYLL